jgi:dTMP kinase
MRADPPGSGASKGAHRARCAPFVTFEGIEGSGKSTQLRLLAARLAGRGIAHATTREPGGTPLADEIRALLLARRDEPVHPETELLLYEASRAQHVRAFLLPRLEGGVAVLCDRYLDATLAYQGSARSIPPERVEALNAFASGGLLPDATFLLDLDPETGLARAAARGKADRIEGEGLPFHRAVREGYLDLWRRFPDRIVRLDGALPAGEIARLVAAEAERRFGW